MITRYSSRRQTVYDAFLSEKLQNAKSYDRIAGYFSSSVLQIAGEKLESISGKIRLVCNSDIDPRDAEVAKAAEIAIRKEWCSSNPEQLANKETNRFARLYKLLREKKLEVRVLPSEKFGLAHGKAGVIQMADGKKTSFIGSVNETLSGWKLNYEMIWEDDSPEAIQWVQEEFEMFWNSPFAIPLSEFVVQDIGRIAEREVIQTIEEWRKDPEPAAPIIESPVYRKETGLAPHQKFFIKTAFDMHKGPYGARLLLADGVGLGKTAQLGMTAQLMALYGDGPVLAMVPKTLLWQWQGELRNLLDIPSAVWNGKQWVDENEIEYPVNGPEGIRDCPRRIGIVSQGLITSGSPIIDHLLHMDFECLIIDEAHRARRKNLGDGKENETPDPNNLLKFLLQAAPRAKSVLLATATPVQMYPVEIFDLINILSLGNSFVYGNEFSKWRRASESLPLIMGHTPAPTDDTERWDWIRNPLPPKSEHLTFSSIRRTLKLRDNEAVARGELWDKLTPSDKRKIGQLASDFPRNHNPVIRHVIRRTRSQLEDTVDPETNEPMLKKVEVELLGEGNPIVLPPYLLEAYHTAEHFCSLLAKRAKGAGFLKTLLLRRVGSSIEAGKKTAQRMLKDWGGLGLEEDNDEEVSNEEASKLKDLTAEEFELLEQFVAQLESNSDKDPKYAVVLKCLRDDRWLEQGCIVFSQYFDSIWWLGEQLCKEFPNEPIGIYAGGSKSGILKGGKFTRTNREVLKEMVFKRELRLLLGTESASEGLNLQKLGTLINLDLPWNPTRLEQRKGRIQRIGQVKDKVFIYNMRYAGSVEDRVHELLSDRLNNIFDLFGQIPDILEDAWIAVAEGDIEEAKRIIGAVPTQHPFELKYKRPAPVPWETCAKVLDAQTRVEALRKGWL